MNGRFTHQNYLNMFNVVIRDPALDKTKTMDGWMFSVWGLEKWFTRLVLANGLRLLIHFRSLSQLTEILSTENNIVKLGYWALRIKQVEKL